MPNTQTEKMIDVAEDYHCPNQSASYHEAYKKWRRKPDNKYAYVFSKHPKETAFSENPTIQQPSQSKTEQNVIGRIANLIGFALLLFYAAENLFDKLLIEILNLMHYRIDFVYLEYSVSGDEMAVFIVTAVISFLKHLLPMIFLMRMLRMPLKVRIPLRIHQPHQLLAGMALIMLLSAGLGTFLVPDSTELKKYQMLLDSIDSADHMIFTYEMFLIFVLPLVIEMLLHGSMFQVLRQFGDTFAIGTVTVISMLMMHTPSDMLRVGLITLMISYYMVQTGSFLTALLLHIIHEIYMFALYFIETQGNTYTLLWWTVLLLPCVIGAAALAYGKIAKLHTAAALERRTVLEWQDKVAAFFSAKLMLTATILALLMAMVISMMV